MQIKGFEVGVENRARLNAITAKLASKDPSLWGEAATVEAAIRLNWIDLPNSSRELLPALDALGAWSRELKHANFVLCGMGGSSLAPEVIAQTYSKSLTILDSTDPHHVAQVLDNDLSNTCFVIGSKSGSTIETASQKLAVEAQLVAQQLDPKNHIVVVTDPGSPLDDSARASGYKVINADPNVGGRFSALSAFGLTPAALIGVDVSVLLDDAADAAQKFTQPDSAPVQVAAALGDPSFRYVGFCDFGSKVSGLSDWIEQLLAESTGKDQKGLLPVTTDSKSNPLYPVITFDDSGPHCVQGTLGEQFIFWEWVTALICYLIPVDPFNQPNVTEAKEKTGNLLTRWAQSGINLPAPVFETENVSVYADHSAASLTDYFAFSYQGQVGYLAIMAYLHRGVDDAVVELREILERAAQRPTTFGWGPRFLHSTGQFHKGGPRLGSFIQITGVCEKDWLIPNKEYGFATLLNAQALGDNEALAARGFPLIRFNLKNRSAGIAELIAAAKKL